MVNIKKCFVSLVLFLGVLHTFALSVDGIDTNENLASAVLKDDPTAFGIKMKTLIAALKAKDDNQVYALLKKFTPAELTVVYTLLEKLEEPAHTMSSH